ncbi:MAG: hypothetical protein HKO57_01975, partial [Akkermansiaceae bacterium]|nr:hypothetical protein [Akkermansiaceae bacterium]
EGWHDDGTLRKIVATIPGEHGTGVEEYYLEAGAPLFVYTKYDTVNTRTGEVAAVVEDRYYFKEGDLFKWLGPGKQPVAPGSADFAERAQTVKADCTRFVIALGSPAPVPGGARDQEWLPVADTTSHDGSMALAIAVKGRKPTKDLLEELIQEESVEGLVNYIVRLKGRDHEPAVLGETRGTWWSDQRSSGNSGVEVVWSEDDRHVAQLTYANYTAYELLVCRVGAGRLSKAADLLDPSKNAALKKVAGTGHLGNFDAAEFTLAVHHPRIMDTAAGKVVQVSVSGEIAHINDDPPHWDTTVTFRIVSDREETPALDAPVLKWLSTEITE